MTTIIETPVTKLVSRQQNAAGDTYAYQVVLNSKFNDYRVQEYKNGEYFSNIAEGLCKSAAIKKFKSALN